MNGFQCAINQIHRWKLKYIPSLDSQLLQSAAEKHFPFIQFTFFLLTFSIKAMFSKRTG